MRKYVTLLPAVALLFGMTACDSDSGDDSKTDSEIFVGTWAVVDVSDSNGPADLAGTFTSILASFDASGSGSIAVDAIDDTGDVDVDLTYALNESAKTIALNISVPGVGTIPLNMGYSISADEDTVTFTINQSNAVLINSLFGTSLEGAVTMTVRRA